MNQFIRTSIKNIASKLGITVLPSWQVSDLQLEILLVRLIEKYKPNLIIDVGANCGQYHDLIRSRVMYSGIIHSFEPLPHLASQLSSKANNDENWFIHNCALGDSEGTLPLNVMASEVYSSFKEPDSSLTQSFVKGNVIKSVVDVPIRRLDGLASSLKGIEDGSVLLKIDTQGYDFDVLRGAENLLQKVCVLQFELALKPIYKDVPHYSEILDYLQRLGFEISGYFPISYDEKLRAVELDCLMVKDVF